MFFAFLILFLTAIIIYFGNKNESTKWASFFLLCAAFGALSRNIIDSIIPTLMEYHLANNYEISIVYQIYVFLAFLGNSCTPYGVLMFAITYSDIVSQKTRKILACLFAIPIIPMYVLDFLRLNLLKPLLIWAIPYLLISCILLTYAWFKEKNPLKKKDKLLMVLLLLPSLISALLFNYFARFFFPDVQLFRYVVVSIMFSFVLFIIFSFIHSVLGVRLRFERQVREGTIKAMTSGATIINHTIKNEIGKIAMVYHNIKSSSGLLSQSIEENLEVLYRSKEHMMAMVEKINTQMQEIILEETPSRLIDIVEESMTSIFFYFQNKAENIEIIKDYAYDPHIICDRIHMKEVIMNIIKNAIEAMIHGGTLSIQIIHYKNTVVLSIKDTGVGISGENRSNVFSPFFSTKARNLNFGLGLSYCYNVMQKSNASIKFESEENQGANFMLIFPKHKIMRNGAKVL
ncbi:MAG: signal transduction histidine kinase [Bacilli bacterium]|nr:signal transduction histidine kinase [Bacilli bacterium]